MAISFSYLKNQYLKTLQALGATDSPTFAGATLSGLTASSLVATDANKALTSTVTGLSPSFTGLTLSGDLTLTAGGSILGSGSGNIVIKPGTGITVIGDAGATSHSLAANDDLFVSGMLEVDSTAYFDGQIYSYSYLRNYAGIVSRGIASYMQMDFGGDGGEAKYTTKMISELVTIPVGSGNTPTVDSAANLAPANSIIKAVVVRVTQAPGGGATVVSVGRKGGNEDEFIDDISTALATTGNSVANNDGVLTAADMWNATASKFTITTDADVTGTDMKIRIAVWYDLITDQTA
jgi:hypothetical protein